jgi:hypothetical protein
VCVCIYELSSKHSISLIDRLRKPRPIGEVTSEWEVPWGSSSPSDPWSLTRLAPQRMFETLLTLSPGTRNLTLF